MNTRSKDLLTLGVEDGGFLKSQARRFASKTLLVGVLFHDLRVNDLRIERIVVDGTDATENLLKMLESFESQPSPLLLGGISYGGFNFIDPFSVQKETGLSSIILTTERPDNQAVKAALQGHFRDWEMRWKIYARLNHFREVRTNPNENPIFMETVGISGRKAASIVKDLTVLGRMPEPLRVARILAHQLTKGRDRARY